MAPLQFLLGFATFHLAIKLKKPIRSVAVVTTRQIMSIADSLKTTAYGFKEEMEDIVAEAQYENMKRNMDVAGDNEEKSIEK